MQSRQSNRLLKHVIKGLNSIIPDELLAIFDEIELEVNIM